MTSYGRITGFLGVLVTVLLVGGLAGCGESESLHERIKHSTGQGSPEPVPAIRKRWDQADTLAVSEFDRRTFYVLDRTRQIKQYPCGNCHTESFTMEDFGGTPKRAHWDIEVDHGPVNKKQNFTCATCHDPRNPDRLITPSGDSVAISRSYRQCGECHQQQLKDWVGGAHGKQIDYWQGPRVIYACAQCHNPHSPALEKRWPVTYPRVPRSEGRSSQ